MARGLLAFDRRELGESSSLVGVDEAGRGALAGPVFAAAVQIQRSFFSSNHRYALCRGVDDSKRLNAFQRARIVERVAAKGIRAGIAVSVGCATVGEIEQFNILQATVLAMRRALMGLGAHLDTESKVLNETNETRILVDGRPLKSLPLAHQGVVGGDRKSLAIALAGIHAKEARDAAMCTLCEEFPDYGFSTHKGYGTPDHVSALRKHGPCELHRALFIRKPLGKATFERPIHQGSLF